MTTLVLVHGLWSDGSAWSETIAELRALGRDSVAAQLPLESLESDVAAVRRVLSVIEGPVLLVGWSYGGAVITNAAVGQSHVKALSYLAAFAPEEGETVRGIVQRRPGSLIPQHLKVTDDGHSYIDRPAYGKVVAADAAAERIAVAAAVQKHPRLGVDAAPSGAPAWRELPSHYLVATQDNALPAATQRELAERIGAQTTEWETGHGPMYAHPKELAAYLDGLAKGV
ncbi:alpha/beta hydrolase [Streptomyces sp. 2314.4]|uniref:alpha/beta hydrolase n=1 Tax=Streptomyces sp. 2314.4 TaxID=1881025 RepID=UPI00089841C3|nr:alpha/beta hydrolase [Streptomyces sp. 2314.4]SED46759.1 Pimeloyl-ACP methyl ester carboxylesterase [Streptomyces sp. 2314.4]